MKLTRHYYGQGYFLSTHDEYRRVLKKEDRLRNKEETKQRFRVVSSFFKKCICLVQKHPIVFSAVMILIMTN